MMHRFVIVAAVALGLAVPARAGHIDEHHQKAKIQKDLDAFRKNTPKFMNRQVPKHKAKKWHPFQFLKKFSHFGWSAKFKHALRVRKMKWFPKGREAPGARDQAQALVDKFEVRTLPQIEQRGLRTAKLAETPWSDDYWAIYSGVTAKRYSDVSMRSLIGGQDWKKITDAMKLKLGKNITQANVGDLSPAEKYDLIVGDGAWTLTRHQLNEGAAYWSPSKKVETWMGICHGWAPAAYNLPRAKKTINVKSADGRFDIPFYPADIRALGSLLWAETHPTTRFIGGRCNVEKPPQDPATGRVQAAECRDTNPGTWHLAIVNQIGVAKRSFVIDATFDYEVWNQPVYSYKYSYFNPQRWQYANSLQDATVAKAAFTKDRFKAFRNNPAATHFVGIAMDVQWVVEVQPSHSATNSPANDLTSGARYFYDVELDAQGNIIGGEWYQNAHPDFLWNAPAGTKARSSVETGTMVASAGTWDATGPMPANWRSMAPNASRAGEPLSLVVEALSTRANR